MKRYRTASTYITCKCDVCLEKLYFPEPDEVTALYDTISAMVVCDACQPDFEISSKVWEVAVNWVYPPDRYLDYEQNEPDDYTND